jgi:hypothetical protein
MIESILYLWNIDISGRRQKIAFSTAQRVASGDI